MDDHSAEIRSRKNLSRDTYPRVAEKLNANKKMAIKVNINFPRKVKSASFTIKLEIFFILQITNYMEPNSTKIN